MENTPLIPQQFAVDLGRIFEIGFNTGLLAAIQHREALVTHFGTLYQQDLNQLSFPPLAEKIYRRHQIVGPWDREMVERWLIFFLLKGFLAGSTFWEEYLQSFAQELPYAPREIIYLQCNFYGDNSFGTYTTKNDQTAANELMEQLSQQFPAFQWTDADFQEYRRRGCFLKADTLLLLRYGKHWRILSVDESVFSITSLAEATDLTDVGYLRAMLARDLWYARSKSVFARLSIDTDAETLSQELLSSQLQHYFAAFKRQDKESAKLIQAASYAYSFYHFLLTKGILTEHDEVLFNAIGYTDRGINSITLRKEHLPVLATCANMYQNHEPNQPIAEAREHVLNSIQRAMARSFRDGRTFLKDIVHLGDLGEGIHWCNHTETLSAHVGDFVNTRLPLDPAHLSPAVHAALARKDYEGKNILDIHAALTRQELWGPTPYLFLTGHPGSGKTTVIVNALKERVRRGENVLFLYISPRKTVNLDIIQKFQTDDGQEPACEELFGLTTSSLIIRNNQNQPTVQYYSSQRQDTFSLDGVEFVYAESEQAKEQRTAHRKIEEIQEGLFIDKGERLSGVLDSLCRALRSSLMTMEPAPRAIVATVAIQSLKRTKGGRTTLRHLDTIFADAYSSEHGVLPEQMAKIGRRIQHLFVMIDEVTGDESGAEFLDGIQSFLHKYDLFNPQYGINTKIIVADASIVDPRIIRQHLATTSYEPNKIYFRRLLPHQIAESISRQTITFKNKPAVVINANAYPASKLHLTYKVGVDVIEYDEETFKEHRRFLQKAMQERMVEDILALLDIAEQPCQSDQMESPQILVYIQDKQRLGLLTEAIRRVRKEQGKSFAPTQDYLEIHANISEEQKKEIKDYQNRVSVIFMTASASRGLSFYRTRYILIDIPRFEIEQNLMEILQVIYRGRGGKNNEDLQEKWLTFYLADHVVYTDATDRDLSVRESMLSLLNVLLILKTSLMTRIRGSGTLGYNQEFMIIPIGGKSVYAAGETFTLRISRLIKELRDISYSHREDQRLVFVYTTLTRLLSDARIRLIGLASNGQPSKEKIARQSYLTQLPLFAHQFAGAARKGFHHLLTLPALEKAFLAGSLLIVPIEGKMIQEHYWMVVKELLHEREVKGRKFDLLANMRDLLKVRRYPESIHTTLKDAIALIEALKQSPEVKASRFQQENVQNDQHYTLPLVTFVAYETMAAYFGKKDLQEESDEDVISFRKLLALYIQTLYPADSLLPIGSTYDVFPFLLFRSMNLAEARRKIFTDHYLFMSHELNILNMLLASKEPENDV